MAVRHADGLMRIWDAAATKPLFSLDPAGHWIPDVAWSADGKRLVGGQADASVLIVWDVSESN